MNSRRELGDAALTMECRKSHVQTAGTLLNGGADIDAEYEGEIAPISASLLGRNRFCAEDTR